MGQDLALQEEGQTVLACQIYSAKQCGTLCKLQSSYKLISVWLSAIVCCGHHLYIALPDVIAPLNLYDG